eukprot:scaffold15038_cov74-Phaeocystis_antarctica.AAC.2
MVGTSTVDESLSAVYPHDMQGKPMDTPDWRDATNIQKEASAVDSLLIKAVRKYEKEPELLDAALAEEGCDVNSVDKYGMGALHLALKAKLPKVTQAVTSHLQPRAPRRAPPSAPCRAPAPPCATGRDGSPRHGQLRHQPAVAPRLHAADGGGVEGRARVLREAGHAGRQAVRQGHWRAQRVGRRARLAPRGRAGALQDARLPLPQRRDRQEGLREEEVDHHRLPARAQVAPERAVVSNARSASCRTDRRAPRKVRFLSDSLRRGACVRLPDRGHHHYIMI